MWDRSANRKQVIPKLVSHINNIGQHYGGVIIMAIKDYADVIRTMREDNKSYGDIAKVIGYHRDSVKTWCRKNGLGGLRAGKTLDEREKNFKQVFENSHADFIYLSGYKDYESKVKIKCKACGEILYRTAQYGSPSKQHIKIQCDRCTEERKLRRQLVNILARRHNSIIRQQIKSDRLDKEEQQRIEREKQLQDCVCEECGKIYTATSIQQKYCSTECASKHASRVKEIKRRKRLKKNGKIEWDISLDKLINRDKNICHICGEQCEGDDYTTTEEGYFIAGERYPSIDHVIPVAKGGTHTWKNVKLAHRGCNNIKNDKIIYEETTGQLRLF